MAISCFLGAVVGGFVLMAAVGIQALVALFSSIPLAKRRKKEHPDFDLNRAYHRILVVSVSILILMAAVTVALLRLTSTAPSLGFLLGMILGFVASLPRMSPNNQKNQKNFEKVYADCYASAGEEPDDAGAVTHDEP